MSMNISPSDMAALQAMFQGANNIDWTKLLGYVQDNGSNPAQGTGTLSQATEFGTLTPVEGAPYNQGTGLSLAAQQDLGAVNGLPTLTAQNQQANIQGSYNPVVNYQWVSTTHGVVPTGTMAYSSSAPGAAPPTGSPSGAGGNISDGY